MEAHRLSGVLNLTTAQAWQDTVIDAANYWGMEKYCFYLSGISYRENVKQLCDHFLWSINMNAKVAE